MKGKVVTLIIGILIGAIIASAGFLIYTKTSRKGNDFGGPPQMNQSQDGTNNKGTPPELPNGEKQSNFSDFKDRENDNDKSVTDTQNNNDNQKVTDTQNNEQTQTNL